STTDALDSLWAGDRLRHAVNALNSLRAEDRLRHGLGFEGGQEGAALRAEAGRVNVRCVAGRTFHTGQKTCEADSATNVNHIEHAARVWNDLEWRVRRADLVASRASALRVGRAWLRASTSPTASCRRTLGAPWPRFVVAGRGPGGASQLRL